MENLLTPDLLRRLAWSPPGSDPTSVAAYLRAGGAREWQIQLIAAPLAPAMADPDPIRSRLMLVAVDADTVDALLDGDAGGLDVAPGWPHDDTAAGLAFVRSGGTQFLVLDDAGRIAGECGTKTPMRPDGSVEIGYGLAAPSRGHGLGGRAVAELVEWLEEQPGIRVIVADVHVSNTASRRIVERLGFVPEGPPQEGYLQYQHLAHGSHT